jgi:glycosyltransferase involved in cell wall biosynthesis
MGPLGQSVSNSTIGAAAIAARAWSAVQYAENTLTMPSELPERQSVSTPMKPPAICGAKGGQATVVAVPAFNEAGRIVRCLHAILDQRSLNGEPLPLGMVKVVVLANNCSDRTAELAREVCSDHIQVLDVQIPPEQANAGVARRAAMEAAMRLLPDAGGLICTTDADSRPRREWIARLWEGIARGADAVAGAIDFDPEEGGAPRVSPERRREATYSVMQAEITARADPEAHNPWPNHIWAWGANLAVTSAAYHRVGGLPAVPLAEDRAFVDLLRRHDVRVRHCLSARVWTSPRVDGRAPGGLASLVRDHASADLEPCDAALEPANVAYQRAALRSKFRKLYAGQIDLAQFEHCGMVRGAISEALACAHFGDAWSRVESELPALARRRLGLGQLAFEIHSANKLLATLRPVTASDDVDDKTCFPAGLWS